MSTTLMPCPSCRRQVSVRASACPHCGDPLTSAVHTSGHSQATGLASRSGGTQLSKRTSAITVLLGVFYAAVLLWMTHAIGMSLTRTLLFFVIPGSGLVSLAVALAFYHLPPEERRQIGLREAAAVGVAAFCVIGADRYIEYTALGQQFDGFWNYLTYTTTHGSLVLRLRTGARIEFGEIHPAWGVIREVLLLIVGPVFGLGVLGEIKYAKPGSTASPN